MKDDMMGKLINLPESVEDLFRLAGITMFEMHTSKKFHLLVSYAAGGVWTHALTFHPHLWEEEVLSEP